MPFVGKLLQTLWLYSQVLEPPNAAHYRNGLHDPVEIALRNKMTKNKYLDWAYSWWFWRGWKKRKSNGGVKIPQGARPRARQQSTLGCVFSPFSIFPISIFLVTVLPTYRQDMKNHCACTWLSSYKLAAVRLGWRLPAAETKVTEAFFAPDFWRTAKGKSSFKLQRRPIGHDKMDDSQIEHENLTWRNGIVWSTSD